MGKARTSTGCACLSIGNLARTHQENLKAKIRFLLKNERSGYSLAASDLYQSLYIRLMRTPNLRAQTKAGFLALCNKILRNLLVSYARKRKHLRQKQGGSLPERLPAIPVEVESDGWTEKRKRFCRSLERLQERFPHKAQIARMIFVGYKTPQICAALGKDKGYVDRHWASAKIFLEADVLKA